MMCVETGETMDATLYLMRHGQTEFNVAKRVQGRCDSPLTELGRDQARAAGRWLAERGVVFDRMLASPLGRARVTLDVVRHELSVPAEPPVFAAPSARPPIEFAPGLIERSYGIYEGGSQADVPADLWDPGEELVEQGGEGSRAVRERMLRTLIRAMQRPGTRNVLAVSHGLATLQFKRAWEHRAACAQDVPLGNCCILVYRFDATTRTFTCQQIVNQLA